MQGYLTKEQKKELLIELRKEDKRRYADRIRVILLLDKGWTYNKIAEALFLDEGTIANYRRRYKEGGLEGLIIDDYSGRRSFLNEKEQQILSNFLQSKICLSTKEIINFIEKKFGVSYTVSGITDLLHRIGFTYKKAKSVPGKANKEKQKEFIELYRSLIPEGKIYFSDSTHPYHNPVISYGWIKKGEDYNVLSNSGRYHLNINGAVDIKNLDIVTRTCDWVNADSMCDLLKAIRNKNLSGELIHLIMDNASYNRSAKLTSKALELGINLVYLPPYSPNLNPIERLWKFFKKKVLYNRYYETKRVRPLNNVSFMLPH
jgi:transposase